MQVAYLGPRMRRVCEAVEIQHSTCGYIRVHLAMWFRHHNQGLRPIETWHSVPRPNLTSQYSTNPTGGRARWASTERRLAGAVHAIRELASVEVGTL
jgi:hypothetical protein